MASGADTARARWELENAVAPAPAADADAWYRYDATAAATVQQQRPWQKDPTYFKQCVAFVFGFVFVVLLCFCCVVFAMCAFFCF
jgi:hypothetical protein